MNSPLAERHEEEEMDSEAFLTKTPRPQNSRNDNDLSGEGGRIEALKLGCVEEEDGS
jgi:hypothetical protein